MQYILFEALCFLYILLYLPSRYAVQTVRAAALHKRPPLISIIPEPDASVILLCCGIIPPFPIKPFIVYFAHPTHLDAKDSHA